ncbi:MAG TPA: hypothetical protein VMW89_16675 [Desulfatiglandales bacterium]|nr:hypothetical protein [Desulfatiglandales bacterium]
MHRIDADILPKIHGSPELGNMLVVANMDSRDAIFQLVQVADKRLEVGDLSEPWLSDNQFLPRLSAVRRLNSRAELKGSSPTLMSGRFR